MKVKNFKPANGLKISHRKENHFTRSISVIYLGPVQYDQQRELINLRIYETQNKSYACFWLHDKIKHIEASGSGAAGGCGYHMGSEAAEQAYRAAGFNLDELTGGRGWESIEEALKAIAMHLGHAEKYLYIYTSHA